MNFRFPWQRQPKALDAASGQGLDPALGDAMADCDAVAHLAIMNDFQGIYADRRAGWDGFVGLTRRIVDAANRSTSSERIIILDCCHAGAVGELFGSLIDMPLKRGVSILAACRKEQSATERNGRGLFTSHICDALSGGAADVRGLVNVPGIYSYVDEVLTLHEPRPLLKANVSELVPIRRAAPAVADEKLRKLTTYFPKMTHQFQLDPSFEPTAQPDHPVNEAIFADLQQYRAARLLTPDGEEHMFYAAMNSKTCSLTPLGQHYWLRVQAGKI